MVHQKDVFVLDLKSLISQCSPCLRVIELPVFRINGGSTRNDHQQ